MVAAIIEKDGYYFATQRGHGEYKGWWEFPGGKIEEGESKEKALIREIKEELDTDIKVNEYLCTIEYDYPNFHLIMHTYICALVEDNITLLEHESSKWLSNDELLTVEWLPADLEVIKIYFC